MDKAIAKINRAFDDMATALEDAHEPPVGSTRNYSAWDSDLMQALYPWLPNDCLARILK